MLLEEDKAPSAVCANEIPSLALRDAWFKPRICELKRSEIARPAASSFALLMRKPEDRRCMEVDNDDCELVKLRCAVNELMLVLMVEAILVTP
jgi:hypothetical protein